MNGKNKEEKSGRSDQSVWRRLRDKNSKYFVINCLKISTVVVKCSKTNLISYFEQRYLSSAFLLKLFLICLGDSRLLYHYIISKLPICKLIFVLDLLVVTEGTNPEGKMED